MTYFVFRQYSWTALARIPKGTGLPFMVGMDLVIAMPISWLPLISDYSRFARDSRTCFQGTWIGYFLISSWMYLLGLAASLATRSLDPSGIVMELMVRSGWVLPALLIVLFSTFTTTFLDIYSAAVSGLNVLPGMGEKRGVLIAGALGTGTAILFPDLLKYEHFLLFIGAMFCPLFGVVLTDYFWVRKGTIQEGDLYARGGKYWYRKGVNPAAVCSWTVGFAIYLGFSPQLMEKVFGISYSFPWPAGSSLPSMVVAGWLYGCLQRRRVR
jgi:putative hydroxymethylpyrimidine transporter CytX